MFDELMKKLYRKKAELDFELARCHDPYRLQNLLDRHINELQILRIDAATMVEELEYGL